MTYWIQRPLWGKGIASEALRQFLKINTFRPLYARCSADNLASRRVLEKSSFRKIREERNFAKGRGMTIAETIYRLEPQK